MKRYLISQDDPNEYGVNFGKECSSSPNSFMWNVKAKMPASENSYKVVAEKIGARWEALIDGKIVGRAETKEGAMTEALEAIFRREIPGPRPAHFKFGPAPQCNVCGRWMKSGVGVYLPHWRCECPEGVRRSDMKFLISLLLLILIIIVANELNNR